MDLQDQDNVPPNVFMDKEEDQVDQAGPNNNNLPTQVSVDELELLRKLEEANRWGWCCGGGGRDEMVMVTSILLLISVNITSIHSSLQ